MAFISITYRNATKITNRLLQHILDEETKSSEARLLALTWVDIEAFKREIRGLPRLAPSTIAELMTAKANHARRIGGDVTIEEIPDEQDKETPSRETVPTPPEGEAPSAPVVANDK